MDDLPGPREPECGAKAAIGGGLLVWYSSGSFSVTPISVPKSAQLAKLSIATRYFSNLITANPPTSKIVKTIVKRLKYLSIKVVMRAPKAHISPATRKNRNPRPRMEAITNGQRGKTSAPDAMVKTL